MKHEHNYIVGKSGTVAICSCGRFQHVNPKPEDIITEQRTDDYTAIRVR